jgi:hypothetical protein
MQYHVCPFLGTVFIRASNFPGGWLMVMVRWLLLEIRPVPPPPPPKSTNQPQGYVSRLS